MYSFCNIIRTSIDFSSMGSLGSSESTEGAVGEEAGEEMSRAVLAVGELDTAGISIGGWNGSGEFMKKLGMSSSYDGLVVSEGNKDDALGMILG